jgi:hypothetical protein
VGDLVGLLRPEGILLIADLLLGPQPPTTPYRWYQPMDIIDTLEALDTRFSIETQCKLKRTISRRYDVAVYKD